MQVAALAAALGGALLLTWTERIWPDVQEAVIGVVFVLGATGGVLLLASNVHGGEHLRDLLVGQILWVQPSRLAVGGGCVRGGAGALVRPAASGSGAPASTCSSRSRSRCRCSSWASTSCSPRSSCRRSPRGACVARRLLAAWALGAAGYAAGSWSRRGRPAERAGHRVDAGGVRDRRRGLLAQGYRVQ